MITATRARAEAEKATVRSRGSLLPSVGAYATGAVVHLHSRLFWTREIFLRRAPALSILSRLIDRGDVVIDGGAHRGLMTAWLASRVGPQGAVHAFEPNPHFHDRLDALAIRMPWIRVHKAALSSRDGDADLHVPRLNGKPCESLGRLSLLGAYRHVESDTVRVPTVTIDVSLAAVVPALIKLDVEGHELDVLQGARELLRSTRPELWVEIEQRHSERAVSTFDFLGGLGYSGWFLGREGLIPLGEFDVEEHQLRFLREPTAEVVGGEYVFDFLFRHDARLVG